MGARLRLAGGLLLLILTLSGCASLIGRGDWDPFRSGGERRLTVMILNESRSTVSVRAISAGQRVGLGTVDGNARANFSIPWSRTQEVRFQLEPLMGRGYTTSGVTARPGERLQVWVRDPVQQSRVAR